MLKSSSKSLMSEDQFNWMKKGEGGDQLDEYMRKDLIASEVLMRKRSSSIG